MTRDWKEVSKKLSAQNGGKVFLNEPDLDLDDVPEWVVPYECESPHLEVGGPSVAPREIRKFLWDNRNSRSVLRDRAFVWSRYDSESDSSTVGLGALTVKPAIDRLGSHHG